MIPDQDDFLLTLGQFLKQIYAGEKEQEVLNEFATLMADVEGDQGARGGRGGGDDFRAFQLTIPRMPFCVKLREKHKSVYDLIGLCFLFSALRKDGSLCLSSKRFETVSNLLKTNGIDVDKADL
jgi:hypothetical protein